MGAAGFVALAGCALAGVGLGVGAFGETGLVVFGGSVAVVAATGFCGSGFFAAGFAGAAFLAAGLASGFSVSVLGGRLELSLVISKPCG